MLNFFLVLDLVLFGPGVAVWTRVQSALQLFFLLSTSHPLHYVNGMMMDYTYVLKTTLSNILERYFQCK